MLTRQPQNQIRFDFETCVSMEEVEGTLELAQIAAESLHGRGRVELEASCETDVPERSVLIDARSDAGRTLALIFLGYVRREFGGSAFKMKRVAESAASHLAAVGA
jgi:hypothetical protein